VQASASQRSVKRIVASAKVLPGLFPGRHHMMVEVSRHTDLGDSPCHILGTARRIRQQDDSLAVLHQCSQASEGAGGWCDPIMNHAPQIENETIITRRELTQAGEQSRLHGPA
jgi:hypothetical protein